MTYCSLIFHTGTNTQPAWYWRTTEYESDEDPNKPVWEAATTMGTASSPSSSSGTVDTIWHSSSSANEIWCRMAYGGSSASLTLTHSYNGNVHSGNLLRNGIYQFVLAKGSISGSNWYKSWFTLQATTSVVVSARSGAQDARAVPAISQRFVGWSSMYGKMAPFYHKTIFHTYYYEENNDVSAEYTGGIDDTDPTKFITNTNGVKYLRSLYISNYECAGAVHAYGTKPLGISTYNDGDGADATTFFPIERLSTEFILPKKAEWVSFMTVRPEASKGLVHLSVYDSLGRLIDVIDTLFARSSSKQDSSALEDEMRPSCYKYTQVSGVPAGTKFVTDYPTHMVFQEFVTQDETTAFGRGSWGWVQLNKKVLHVKEKDQDPTTMIQQYKIRFQSHDPNGKLGYGSGDKKVSLGVPLFDIKISLSTDSEIAVAPSYIIFTKDNWNEWQTINVSAVEDNKVETLVKTSTIHHFVDTLDPNFADGRVTVPDVLVDVTNVDFDSTVRNLNIKTVTGGMLGIEWEPPAATLAAGNTDTFDYILEITEATSDFVPPTVLTQTVNCTTVQCTATGYFDINDLSNLRSASISISVRKTDFNDATEIVEIISATVTDSSATTATAGNTETKPLRTNCNPGKSENDGYCGSTDAFTCVTKSSIFDLLRTFNEGNRTSSTVSLSVHGTISEDVGPLTGDCKDEDGLLVPLFTMDITLELVYKSNDEVYYGNKTHHFKPGLKHSTPYRVRAATMNNHGVLSAWTPNEMEGEPPLIIKTTRPTMPTAPNSPNYKTTPPRDSRTGGSLTLVWEDVFDTGGAEIVEYHTLAMKVGISGGGTTDTTRDINFVHNTTSFVPDDGRPWTTYSNVETRPVQKEDTVVGLKPYSIYNLTVYALNDVEFCVGNSLTGYERAHVILESGFPVCNSVLLETGKPSTPSSPLDFTLLETDLESGGSVSIQVTKPHDCGGHDSLQYDIDYRRVSDGISASYSTIHGTTWYESQTSPVSLRVEHLKPNTNYEMRVRVSTQSIAEDSFTLTATGCECEHDPRRTDCACCATVAYKQCGAVARRKCYNPLISSILSACDGDRSDLAYLVDSESILLYDWKQKEAANWPGTLSAYTYAVWMKVPSASPSLNMNVNLLSFGVNKPTLTYSYLGNEGIFVYATAHSGDANVTHHQIVGKDWVHVAITRDNTVDSLYVDGQHVKEFIHSTLPTPTSTKNDAGVSPFLQMLSPSTVAIDNAQLWSKAMSIDEIRTTAMKGAMTTIELDDIASNTNDLLVYEDFNNKGLTTNERSKLVRSTRGFGSWSTTKIFQTPLQAERPTQPSTSPTLVSVHGGAVVVKWPNEVDNGGSPVTKYHLFRTEANSTGEAANMCTEKVSFEHPTNKGILVDKKSDMSVGTIPYGRTGTVVRLEPSTTYGICVASSNVQGRSETSPPLTITTTAATVPGKPSPPYVMPAPSSLSWDETIVGWKEPADVGGSSVIGYYLEWMKESDVSYTRLASLHDDLLHLNTTIDSMIANTLYTYRVIAVNAIGESLSSDNYTKISSAVCLLHFYGEKCESFGLCTLDDAMTATNPMKSVFCNDLNNVIGVSDTYGGLFPSPTGAMGTGNASQPGVDSAEPLPTLQAAVDSSTASRNMIFIYPDVIENLVGYCNVRIDKNVSILGIRNSSEDWQGSTIKCTNETKYNEKFNRFLIVEQGVTLQISGITLEGGGIEVQGGTLAGSLFTISNAVGTKHGGAFWVHDGGTVSLTSVDAHHNQATYGGAISAWDKSKIVLCDTSIYENEATKDGGGIWMLDSSLSLSSSCTNHMSMIQTNTATRYGGGIHCTGAIDVIDNSTGTPTVVEMSGTSESECSIDGALPNSNVIALSIASNRLHQRDNLMFSGAGISFKNVYAANLKSINVESNVIEGNGWGSGISVVDVVKGTISNTTINSNTLNVLPRMNDPLISGGAGLNVLNSTVDVKQCTIVENDVKSVSNGGSSAESSASGGGLLVHVSSTVNLVGGSIERNHGKNGGGIDVQGTSKLTITQGTVLRKNYVSEQGGGLRVGTGSTLSANVVMFDQNMAGELGGGAAVTEASSGLTMVSASFIENSAVNGGAVAVKHAAFIDLTSCTMVQNSATKMATISTNGAIVIAPSVVKDVDTTIGNGGDFWVSSVSNTMVTLTDVTTTNSSADNDGGSLWSAGAIITVNNHVVDGASAQGHGGVYALFAGTLTSISSTYKHTTSQFNGGVVYATLKANVSLDTVAITDVQSEKGSGGVASMSDQSALLIKASHIHRATSHVNGGAVSLSSLSSASVQHLQTVDCTSKVGGVIHLNNATLMALFWNSRGGKATNSGGSLSASNEATVTMIDSILVDSDAVIDGGHIWLNGHNGGGSNSSTDSSSTNSLALENVTLKQGSAERGGALYAASSSILHDGTCSIENNEARSIEGGGSLYLSDSIFVRAPNKTLHSSLTGSLATNGGAVTAVGTVLLNYLTVTNHFTNNSGTIHVCGNGCTLGTTSGSSLTLEHVDMDSNVVGDYGGHIYIDEGAGLTARHVQWTNGTADKGGGALYGAAQSRVDGSFMKVVRNKNTAVLFEGTSMQILLSTFTTNSADQRSNDGGGAIHVRNGANVSLVRTTFEGNIATNKEGGDVACSGLSTCTIQFTSFQGNEKSSDPLNGIEGSMLPSKGGAVAVLGGSTAHISNTIFNRTYSKIGGGAISVSYSNLKMNQVEIHGARSKKGAGLLLENAIDVRIDSTLFSTCISLYDGGAVHATDSVVVASNLQLLSNRAGIFGGAILVSEKASFNLTNSTFQGNVAWLGGGLAMDRDSKASVAHTSFTDNQARMGGAFYVSVNENLVTFEHSLFANNQARFGSALFIEFSYVNVEDCIVKNNVATLFAAVRVTGVGGFSASSSLFQSNLAQKGGAMYADDTTQVNLFNSTFAENVAEDDGGAIYCGGATDVKIYGCRFNANIAKQGQGGAVSRTNGARLLVDQLNRGTIQKTTFSNNKAKSVGGAMSLNSLLCRSATTCATNADSVNTMTSAYESCRSGDARASSINNDVSQAMDVLEPCTDIQNVHFENNSAAAGAGIFWHRQWHIDVAEHAKYLPCNTATAGTQATTCTFINNVASPCSSCNPTTDPGCYSCTSNIQTDTQTIQMGWSPGFNQSIQSGTPIENSAFITSPEDTDIYLVAVDYYGDLSRLDDQSNCYVERDCTEEPKNCYDMQAGVCKIQNTKNDAMAQKKIWLTGTVATSTNGLIRFLDLIVKADPNPNSPYSIRYVCKTTLASEDSSLTTNVPCIAPVSDELAEGQDESVEEANPTTRRRLTENKQEQEAGTTGTTEHPVIAIGSSFRVDHCSPGSQLTGDQVCERCSAGTYSPDGKQCTECPVGGECTQTIQVSQKTSVTLGTAIPLVKKGYWNNTAPPEWFDNECNTTQIIIPGTKSPYEIVQRWGDNEECQPGNCGADKKWSVNRLHRCRRNKHFYKCDFEEACSFVAGGFDLNGTEQNASICSLGYEGVVCGVCSEGYHKTGNDQCIKCMGDDPFISKILYTGSLSVAVVLFLVLLFFHLRDDGLAFHRKCSCLLVGLVHFCGCCHSFWCCKCLNKKVKMTKEEKIISDEINHMKHAGKRKRMIGAGDTKEHMKENTVWFRPEKYKILLSFLQVFQEFRRTYRIKWYVVVLLVLFWCCSCCWWTCW